MSLPVHWVASLSGTRPGDVVEGEGDEAHHAGAVRRVAEGGEDAGAKRSRWQDERTATDGDGGPWSARQDETKPMASCAGDKASRYQRGTARQTKPVVSCDGAPNEAEVERSPCKTKPTAI